MSNYTIIENKRLKIEIQKPGTLYKGSRFDWTGFITQITLDGSYTFCVPEQFDPLKGTGGIGFCNEFGIDQPIGHDEIDIDEQFPKIGVGLLTKDSEHYDFFKAYNIEPLLYEETITKNQLKVISKIESPSGYSIVLTKTISILDNQLLITYNLDNIGQKRILTNEYCHNFIGINQEVVGPDYTLTIPEMLQTELIAGEMTMEKKHISWPSPPSEDFYGLISLAQPDAPFRWQLYYEPLKVGVRDCSILPISKCALWGYTHVISPELFIQIDLAPHTSMTWQRIYEFYNDNLG